MIIDSCYTFFPIDSAPLNSPVTEPVMNTNLIEPPVLNRKRGDSKLQHVLGAGARSQEGEMETTPASFASAALQE